MSHTQDVFVGLKDAFNFFQRELKNINFHFCYAQAL